MPYVGCVVQDVSCGGAAKESGDEAVRFRLCMRCRPLCVSCVFSPACAASTRAVSRSESVQAAYARSAHAVSRSVQADSAFRLSGLTARSAHAVSPAGRTALRAPTARHRLRPGAAPASVGGARVADPRPATTVHLPSRQKRQQASNRPCQRI